MIGTKKHESGFESESESTLFSLNPNPDSYFLALNPNPNPNPAQKALNPDSNPNPDSDSHITGQDRQTDRQTNRTDFIPSTADMQGRDQKNLIAAHPDYQGIDISCR